MVFWVPCILQSESPLRPQSGEEVDGLSVVLGSKANTKVVSLRPEYSEVLLDSSEASNLRGLALFNWEFNFFPHLKKVLSQTILSVLKKNT